MLVYSVPLCVSPGLIAAICSTAATKRSICPLFGSGFVIGVFAMFLFPFQIGLAKFPVNDGEPKRLEDRFGVCVERHN